MNMQMKWVAGVVVIVVAAVLVVWYIVSSSRGAQAPSASATATSTTATTSVSIDLSGATTTTTGAYTVKTTVISPHAAVPDFSGPLAFSISVPADEKASIESQYASAQAALKKSDLDFNAWISLGTMREEAGDYSGALAAWQFAAQLQPKVPLAYDNIADLYFTYLKDYAKAEANWEAAITAYPADTQAYTNLFALYTTTSYRPSADAPVNILKQGIAANPKAVNLQVMLARYYKSQGDTADAQAEYQAAIQNAQSQGQASLAAEIQQEASSTPQ